MLKVGWEVGWSCVWKTGRLGGPISVRLEGKVAMYHIDWEVESSLIRQTGR